MSTGGQPRAGKASASASYSTMIEGWRALTLENELVSLTALPEYGGWIVSIIYKPRGVELLWRSPRGIIGREDRPVVPDASLGFRTFSPGGWPELFPHGSAAADVRGVRMPFHGEVVNRAWRCELLPAPAGEAAARMSVDCHLLPLRLERVLRVKAGCPAVFLDETVTNLCGIPIDFMWGHHPYYCKPVLGRCSRILAPAGTALDGQFQPTGWPMHGGTDLSLCPPEGAGTSEMFYLAGLAAGWYALVNPEARLGLAMAWDTAVFPYVWIWREANKSMDYPYFGGAYTVAIEPFSSLPGARQRGERLLSLDAGATLSTRLCFSAFEGQKEIAGFDLDGRVTPA